jgi:6-phosphofructokinase
MHTQGALPPMMLTVGNVHDIHHDGGTVLGSSRGGFDSDIIQAKLKEWYTGIDLSLFSAFS